MSAANDTFVALDQIRIFGHSVTDQSQLDRLSRVLSTMQRNRQQPTPDDIKKLFQFVASLLDCFNLNKITGFTQESEMDTYIDHIMCDALGPQADNETAVDCDPTLWSVIYFADKEPELTNTILQERVA